MSLEKKVEQFNLRISENLLKEAQAKAAQLDLSFAWVIRRLIKMWLDGKIQLE